MEPKTYPLAPNCSVNALGCGADLWVCQTCGRKFCVSKHSHDSPKGHNVECKDCSLRSIPDEVLAQELPALPPVDPDLLFLETIDTVKLLSVWSCYLMEMERRGFTEKQILEEYRRCQESCNKNKT